MLAIQSDKVVKQIKREINDLKVDQNNLPKFSSCNYLMTQDKEDLCIFKETIKYDFDLLELKL